MESRNNPILQEDIDRAVAQKLPFHDLNHCTVLVTGATGLIGSQAVKFLLALNRTENRNITVVAYVRSLQKAKDVFAGLGKENGLLFAQGDINETICYDGTVDYIIHGASATSSKYFVSNPVETIHTAIDGTTNIMEFARSKEVKGVVYLSSLEVYGKPDENAGLIAEEEYGYIDCLSVRSSYSEGKRMVECLCASYAQEYNVPVKIARLSQTFGAGVVYDDGRVFAEFARCAIEGRNIVLHTAGKTVRTYCYTMDAVTAILTILLKGETGQAYNVTNSNTAISIYDMAQLVCDSYPEAGIHVECDIPKDLAGFGYNPEMVIRLDSTKLQELGWSATVDLKEMYERLIESMKLTK